MERWSAVVATASLIALLVALGVRARQGTVADQARFGMWLLGAAGLVILVGLIAFVWTLIRP